MDESFASSSSSYDQENTRRPTTTRSGLTLVLPSLKNLKAAKASNKSKRSSSLVQSNGFDTDAQEKKTPRPVKLKPLKDVLAKLIYQIKKKDDYAFFLVPVDSNQVPGYLDVIEHPMDLGTMTNKVNKGKYRSLEEFANDLKLVTTNAKTFNPPGSIYYTEADRIEAWALDHIAKASSTVIQYETDWNIDIERGDDTAVNIDDDDDDENPSVSVLRDDVATNGRSPSVMSQVQAGSGRRGQRGAYKKNPQPMTVSESIDNEGRLPGSKDGLGAFPPCSDWAKTMVALKLKGKRYKTKKERLRFEKEGPPCLDDGSLDYTEMEDPFSVLSVLTPEPLTRPYLTPVYPPLSIPQERPQPPILIPSRSETSTPQPEYASSSQGPSAFPSTINLPLDHDPLSSINLDIPVLNTYPNRKHWHIVRNPTGRKFKDTTDDIEVDEPPWQTPRELHPVDLGSFAVLAGALSEEMKRRGITPGVMKEYEEEQAMLDAIRNSLDPEETAQKLPTLEETADDDFANGSMSLVKNYFSTQRAAEAEEYIRDMVYGGVEGLAYVRSLAEFVTPDASEDATCPPMYPDSMLGLEMPLARYVHNLVDELTEGRHSLLRQTADYLWALTYGGKRMENDSLVATQTEISLFRAPEAMAALKALLRIRLQKIDMSALLNRPEELFLSEEEWAGKGIKAKRTIKHQGAKEESEAPINTMEVEESSDGASMDIDSSTGGAGTGIKSSHLFEMETPEELAEVLEYVARLIAELNERVQAGISLTSPASADTGDPSSDDGADSDGGAQTIPENKALQLEKTKSSSAAGGVASQTTGTATREDPALRDLRLNLLALAKRAPLDTIARLPLELVPEHIRHYIPTLEASTPSTINGS